MRIARHHDGAVMTQPMQQVLQKSAKAQCAGEIQ
jgi:hypothetical protein